MVVKLDKPIAVNDAEEETFVSFLEKAIKTDPADEKAIETLVRALEKKATRLEDRHLQSKPHRDAAAMLREDVDALNRMRSLVMAGRKAIPDFTPDAEFRKGDIVRHGGGIFRALAFNSNVPRSGQNWMRLAGTEPSPTGNSAKEAAASWKIESVSEMPFPDAALRAKDYKTVDDTRQNFLDHGVSFLSSVLRDAGVEPNRGISARMFAEIVGTINGQVTWAVWGVRHLVDRIEALEATGIKFAGTWQRANGYQRGSVVSHHGSAWVALKDHDDAEEPGSSGAWQLMVKRGVDGKDSNR